MSEADKILEMIDSVDPNDRDALDEIDWRVDCFLIERKFTSVKELEDNSSLHFAMGGILHSPEKYTRDRNALKAIRPEHWCATIDESGRDNARKWKCFLICFLSDFSTTVKFLPTEELAELHAIIQAIEYERNQCNTQ